MDDSQARDTRRDTAHSDPEERPTDDTDHERGHGQAHDHHDNTEHDHHEHDVDILGAAVVTVSSTRTVDDDPSGDAICEAFDAAGHEVVTRELVPDDHDRIQRVVDNLTDRGDVDVVVTTGGTGITPDDVTIEAVRSLFGKELPGFGELFRRRSEGEIGTRVIASRATAGIASGVPVFCLPGSVNAAKLGADLVLAEAGHLTGLARREDDHE